ncbi:MAG: helix-turn-helix transcriptional regulator [Alistipes sp.]|nr:helix-turn-helix transcriptional regulator [Candidatus Alistipes equi]
MFEKGLSQKDIAEILGTSQSRISELIAGKFN